MKRSFILSLFVGLVVISLSSFSVASAYTPEQEYELAYMEHTMTEYLINGDWQNLLSFSDEVAKAYPRQASAYFFKGIALDELGRHADAIKFYNVVPRLTDEAGEYLYQARGLAYYKLNKYNEALADYDRSIAIKPTLRALYQRELTKYAIRQSEGQTLKQKTQRTYEKMKDKMNK